MSSIDFSKELTSTNVYGLLNDEFSLTYYKKYILYTYPVTKSGIDHFYVNVNGTFNYDTQLKVYLVKVMILLL